MTLEEVFIKETGKTKPFAYRNGRISERYAEWYEDYTNFLESQNALMLEALKDCYITYEVQTDYFKDMDVAKGVIAGSWLDTPAKIKNIISGEQEG